MNGLCMAAVVQPLCGRLQASRLPESLRAALKMDRAQSNRRRPRMQVRLLLFLPC